MRRGEAVVLLGPPGAGKSTAGRIAAARLGCSFVDLDEEIARAAAAPVDVVFQRGERAFREHELSALARAVSAAGLVAAGAGVVDSARARALLCRLDCVTLDVDDSTALARLLRADTPRRAWLPVDASEAELLFSWRRREATRPHRRAALSRTCVDARGPLADVVDALVRELARLRR